MNSKPKLAGVDGWLTKDEAELLIEAAEKTTGPILEVGCYQGRSTVLLAQLDRPMYCVDPFENFAKWDLSGKKIKEKFLSNIEKYSDLITLFEMRVEDWEPLPCGFCYLDGDHSYEGTLAQIEKGLLTGAKVFAVHDVNDKGGGLRVKKACLEKFGNWDKRANRLATFYV